MQPLEIALSTAVLTLALALVAVVVWPHLRPRRPAIPSRDPGPGREGRRANAALPVATVAAPVGPALVCPTCHREYEAGLQFCPYDARDLVRLSDPAARAFSPGAACPTCKRSFDAAKRFCPFDGEGLVPLATLGAGPRDLPPASFVASLGKICPSCSRRYENEATFCGRDGAELVSVN